MSNHTWIQENLAAYLAGGLTADERTRFEKHCADCVACARALAAARKMENTMADLFKDARPDAGLEERMIEQLQKTPPRRRDWPMWLRFVGGAAAALLFGLVGGGLHFFVAMAEERTENSGKTLATNKLSRLASTFYAKEQNERREPDLVAGSFVPELDERESVRKIGKIANSATEGRPDVDINYNVDRIAEMSVPGAIDLNIPTRNSTFGFADLDGSILEGKPAPLLTDLARSKVGPVSDSKAAPAVDYFRFNLPDAPEGNKPPLPPAGFAPVPSPAPQSFAPNGFAPEPSPNTFLFGQPKEPPQAKEQPVGGQKQPESAATERKIIRTGEMEFEIDVFDAAADTIGKLVAGVKGASVLTTNSQKQPNGKTRGSIVVRMPPESLDKFIVDLRRELAKVGDLKSQRIGSADVTKQYTDIESTLRAERITEEGMLKIMQNVKAEVKDLVAAQRELGIVRTRIEQMEGEIRYYKNQVALSTLTITLFEKELEAPFALVVTEKVNMHIEVEEVEKAQQAAVAAVAEAKGRVVKSELKQFAQGQLKATVHLEVAPTAAGGLMDKLKKLGIVTHHSAERKQEARGGAGKPQELKPIVNDVVFEIELYNAANIRPRELFKMTMATLDVAGHYRNLQDAVAKVKGQVIDGKLNEQDKLNISAHFDFNIQISDRPAIDAAIAAVGPLLSRGTEQAPAGELASDRKVGYRLVLQNVARTQPRERMALLVEVAKVEAKAAEVKNLVLTMNGIVVDSKLRHEPNGTVTIVQVFDVPLSAYPTLVGEIKKSEVRSQQAVTNPQAPDNALATARLELTLTNGSLIVPSDAGLGAQVQKGLSWSFWFFSQCVIFLITGILVVVPCVLGVTFLVRFLAWAWKRSAAKAA